jgi:hypothetical protein
MEYLANPQLQQIGGLALQGAKQLYGDYQAERKEKKKLEREVDKLHLQAQLAQERELQKAQLQQQRDIMLKEGQAKYQKEIHNINLATLKQLKEQGYNPQQIENFISLVGGGKKIYSPSEDMIKEYRPPVDAKQIVNPRGKAGLRKLVYKKPPIKKAKRSRK